MRVIDEMLDVPVAGLRAGVREEGTTKNSGAFQFFVERVVGSLITSQGDNGRQTMRYPTARQGGDADTLQTSVCIQQ